MVIERIAISTQYLIQQRSIVPFGRVLNSAVINNEISYRKWLYRVITFWLIRMALGYKDSKQWRELRSMVLVKCNPVWRRMPWLVLHICLVWSQKMATSIFFYFF